MLPLPPSPRCCRGPIKPFRTKAVITIKKEKPNSIISKGISLHDALPCRHVTWRRPSSFVASFPPLNYLHRQSPKKRKETACRHAEGRSSGGGSRCTCCIISGGAFTKREKKEHAPPLCTQTIPLPPLSRSTVAPTLHGERVPPTRSTGGGAKFVLLFLFSPPPTTPTSTATKGALPPNQTPAHYFFPPFFRRGKEGRGAFLAATGYTEGGRGSAPCNEQSKKGCCCSLPPSLPSERRPFLELRCTQ